MVKNMKKYLHIFFNFLIKHNKIILDSDWIENFNIGTIMHMNSVTY